MKLALGLILSFLVMSPFQVKASNGGKGGDPCQNRIEDIRNDISNWIQSGGSAKLDFKDSQTTLEDYNRKMQNRVSLSRIDSQSSISCTDNPDLVKVDGVDKICASTPDSVKPKLLCYRGIEKNGQYFGGFMAESEEEQYRQIHHEFAVLSFVEDRFGDPSDYPLSSQISSYLQDQVVKMLVVHLLPPANRREYLDMSFLTQQDSFEIPLLKLWHFFNEGAYLITGRAEDGFFGDSKENFHLAGGRSMSCHLNLPAYLGDSISTTLDASAIYAKGQQGLYVIDLQEARIFVKDKYLDCTKGGNYTCGLYCMDEITRGPLSISDFRKYLNALGGTLHAWH